MLEQFRPRRHDHEQRPARVVDESFQEVEQLLLGPVDVLDQHDRGPLRDDFLEELGPRILEAIARRKWVKSVSDVESEREDQNLPRSEPFERYRRRIAFEEAEMLLQHLTKGPVGDAPAVRATQSASAQR